MHEHLCSVCAEPFDCTEDDCELESTPDQIICDECIAELEEDTQEEE